MARARTYHLSDAVVPSSGTAKRSHGLRGGPPAASSLIRLRSGRAAKPLAIATTLVMALSYAFPLASAFAASPGDGALSPLEIPSFDFPPLAQNAEDGSGTTGPASGAG